MMFFSRKSQIAALMADASLNTTKDDS